MDLGVRFIFRRSFYCSPNDLNKTDDSEECNSLWMKGKLKLQKAFSKSSSDSRKLEVVNGRWVFKRVFTVDVLERSSTSTSNVAPLVGNNDMIIIASNNSLDEIISTKSFPDAEDTAHNDPFVRNLFAQYDQ